MPTPGTERLTPVKGNSLGTLAYKGKEHIREINAMVRWVHFKYQHQIVHMVEHLTRDSGDHESKSCFSYPITYGAMANPGTDRVTPARGKSLG